MAARSAGASWDQAALEKARAASTAATLKVEGLVKAMAVLMEVSA